MAKRNLALGGAVPVEPGLLDKAVTIEQRPADDTVDASGVPIDGPWTTLQSPVWMNRQDVKMSERFTAQQESAAVDTRWEMHYRGDMDPELVDVPKLRRLVYQGRVYNIRGASVIGARQGVELETLARAGA